MGRCDFAGLNDAGARITLFARPENVICGTAERERDSLTEKENTCANEVSTQSQRTFLLTFHFTVTVCRPCPVQIESALRASASRVSVACWRRRRRRSHNLRDKRHVKSLTCWLAGRQSTARENTLVKIARAHERSTANWSAGFMAHRFGPLFALTAVN